MKYRFITNFKETELKNIYVAINANEIKDYCFCQTAKDKNGNILPGYYALYFSVNTTEKEIEMFYRALLFIDLHVEKQVDPDGSVRYVRRDKTP